MGKVPKIRIFPHAENRFRDEIDVRNWLTGSLKMDRKGVYLLKEARELMQPEAFPTGSVALFEKNGFIVGMAITEEEPRESTEEEREVLGAGEEWKNCVKFIPGSIWAWNSKQFISYTDLRKTIKYLPEKLRGRYPTVEGIDFLKILQKVAKG